MAPSPPVSGKRRQRVPASSASSSSSSSAAAAVGDAPALRGHRPPRVLFLIAHPDDETMFFTPTIAQYRRWGWDLSVLCVSTGDYYGQGSSRRKELEEACRLLGMKPDFVNHKDLQDGPDNDWPDTVLCPLISQAVERGSIDELVTFDMGGVSGHPNHVALARAVRHLSLQRSREPSSFSSSSSSTTLSLPQNLRVWTLDTTNIVRKYLGPLDLLFSFLEALWGWLRWWLLGLCGDGRRRATCSEEKDLRLCLNDNPCRTYQAMLAHASQFVWYRRLFILFSRYTYVNTLRRREVGVRQQEK